MLQLQQSNQSTKEAKKLQKKTFKILLQENIEGLIRKVTFQMQAVVQKLTKTRKIRIETTKLNQWSL